MQELDEVVLGSWSVIIGTAILFGALFSLLFGLVALVMDGLFSLSDQALMAGVAACVGFIVVAAQARRGMEKDRK